MPFFALKQDNSNPAIPSAKIAIMLSPTGSGREIQGNGSRNDKVVSKLHAYIC